MIHPYITYLTKKIPEKDIFKKVQQISLKTIPIINDYSNRDEVFLSFLEEYLEKFDTITHIEYTPKNIIDISLLANSKHNKSISFLYIPLNKIENMSFILNIESLLILGVTRPRYSIQNKLLAELLKKVKYTDNYKYFI